MLAVLMELQLRETNNSRELVGALTDIPAVEVVAVVEVDIPVSRATEEVEVSVVEFA